MPKKKTTKKVKSFKCPNCGKMQTTVIQWQTVSIGYEYDLTTGDSKDYSREGGDFESWNCINCGMDIPFKIHKKIEKMLGW